MSKKVKIICAILALAVVAAVASVSVKSYRDAKEKERLAALEAEAALKAAEEAEQEEEEVEEEPVVIPIDFEEARKENEDIVAWVNVPGTQVDYPILQSPDDLEEDYYLDHNLDGSKGYPGSIYIQKFNNSDFSDHVTIMYGHNMKNGTMFRTLHNYESREFFDENPVFYVYTPTDAKTYRIIAATTYPDRLIPDYYHYFGTTDEVGKFIDEIYSKDESSQLHFLETDELDDTDHYVVLSTCTSNPTVRWLVIGVLEEDLE